MIAGIGASVCCVGPFALLLAGVSGAWIGNLVALEPYRPLAIGITQRCDGCITLHMHDALRAGATREQVAEAIGVAVLMGGGPASTYATDAWRAFEQFEG